MNGRDAELTEEGKTATSLDPAMELRLAHAVRLSREEDRHTEAADILGDLLQAACVFRLRGATCILNCRFPD